MARAKAHSRLLRRHSMKKEAYCRRFKDCQEPQRVVRTAFIAIEPVKASEAALPTVQLSHK